MKRSRSDPYIEKAIDLGKSNTFSLNPVPYDRLEEILTSADIGIVIYKNKMAEASWDNLIKATGKMLITYHSGYQFYAQILRVQMN